MTAPQLAAAKTTALNLRHRAKLERDTDPKRADILSAEADAIDAQIKTAEKAAAKAEK